MNYIGLFVIEGFIYFLLFIGKSDNIFSLIPYYKRSVLFLPMVKCGAILLWSQKMLWCSFVYFGLRNRYLIWFNIFKLFTWWKFHDLRICCDVSLSWETGILYDSISSIMKYFMLQSAYMINLINLDLNFSTLFIENLSPLFWRYNC